MTFVSNHDVDRFDPPPRAKRALPYAVLMAMSGQPSIFYSDYFGPEDGVLPETLRRLVAVHNGWARGRREIVRLATKDMLAIEREGGLLAVFARPGSAPNPVIVPTGWKGATLVSVDGGGVEAKTDAAGNVALTVPAQGWLLLAPQGQKPMPLAPRNTGTTQVWEFADDLDTGRLGDIARNVSVIAAAGTTIRASVADSEGAGRVTLALSGPDGRLLATKAAPRGKPAPRSRYESRRRASTGSRSARPDRPPPDGSASPTPLP